MCSDIDYEAEQKARDPFPGYKFDKDSIDIVEDIPSLHPDIPKTGVADLIVDMILNGATEEEFTRVIKHSIDIIDAEKHNTDPTRSYFDNKIAELKEKYQSKPIEDDPVNHPSHYTQGGIECIEAIEAACTGLTGDEAYYVGQVIKYIWRWKHKNGLQDLKKAQWYLNRLIDKVVDKTT